MSQMFKHEITINKTFYETLQNPLHTQIFIFTYYQDYTIEKLTQVTKKKKFLSFSLLRNLLDNCKQHYHKNQDQIQENTMHL